MDGSDRKAAAAVVDLKDDFGDQVPHDWEPAIARDAVDGQPARARECGPLDLDLLFGLECIEHARLDAIAAHIPHDDGPRGCRRFANDMEIARAWERLLAVGECRTN
jgi:hypothetical protein